MWPGVLDVEVTLRLLYITISISLLLDELLFQTFIKFGKLVISLIVADVIMRMQQ